MHFIINCKKMKSFIPALLLMVFAFFYAEILAQTSDLYIPRNIQQA